MNPEEFIKLANHFDTIGAFSIADQLEDKFIKTAQSAGNYVFPIPGLKPSEKMGPRIGPDYTGVMLESYFSKKNIPIKFAKSGIIPSFEFDNQGRKAPENVEFSPKGIPQPLGTGDQFFAQKLFDDGKPYAKTTHSSGTISADEFAKRLNKDKDYIKKNGSQEFSPKENLQPKGTTESLALNEIKKAFPSWKPQKVSSEALKISYSKSYLPKPAVEKKQVKTEQPSKKPSVQPSGKKTTIEKPISKKPKTDVSKVKTYETPGTTVIERDFKVIKPEEPTKIEAPTQQEAMDFQGLYEKLNQINRLPGSELKKQYLDLSLQLSNERNKSLNAGLITPLQNKALLNKEQDILNKYEKL